MRFTALAFTAALLAAALSAPQALAMPDTGPVTDRVDSDAPYQGGFYGSYVPDPAANDFAPAGIGVSDAAQQESGATRQPRNGSSQLDADPFPGPPTWPVDPKPIEPVQSAPTPSDDGPPWDTIAIVLAGASLALVGAGTLVGLRRRTRRPRIAV
jgi:hypothetical protein